MTGSAAAITITDKAAEQAQKEAEEAAAKKAEEEAAKKAEEEAKAKAEQEAAEKAAAEQAAAEQAAAEQAAAEQAAAEQAAAAQAQQNTGTTVYWTPNGEVYHSTPNCPSLSRSKTILSGSIEESGKSRGCKNCYKPNLPRYSFEAGASAKINPSKNQPEISDLHRRT